MANSLESTPASRVRGPSSPATSGSEHGEALAGGELTSGEIDDCIKKLEVLEYPELGMEAIWKIEVRAERRRASSPSCEHMLVIKMEGSYRGAMYHCKQ